MCECMCACVREHGGFVFECSNKPLQEALEHECDGCVRTREVTG